MREKIFRSDEIRSFIDHLNIVKEKSKSLFSVESKVTLTRLARSVLGYFWFKAGFKVFSGYNLRYENVRKSQELEDTKMPENGPRYVWILKKRVPNARKLPIYKNKNLFFGVAENFWLAKILLYEKNEDFVRSSFLRTKSILCSG